MQEWFFRNQMMTNQRKVQIMLNGTHKPFHLEKENIQLKSNNSATFLELSISEDLTLHIDEFFLFSLD